MAKRAVTPENAKENGTFALATVIRFSLERLADDIKVMPVLTDGDTSAFRVLTRGAGSFTVRISQYGG